jgi:hypothetical protein
MSLSLNATVPAPITTYTNLIPSQNQNQPNFMATISACVQPFADLTAVLLSLPTNFDLDQAVGTQLDTVGLWIGVTRFLSEAINSYFSFNIVGLGFNQAIWFTTGAPESGLVELDDSDYRLLLEAKVVANHWNGTIQQAYNSWDQIFGADNVPVVILQTGKTPLTLVATVNGVVSTVIAPLFGELSYIAIQDMGNMQMMFILTGQQPNAIVSAIFSSSAIALGTAGVTVYLAMPSVYPGGILGGTPLFGLDAENVTVSGLDHGAWVSLVSTT